MPNCKSCGSWFAAVNKREVLCPTCEKAMARLAGYAVPVIRCKDCKHFVGINVDGKGFPACQLSGMTVSYNEFCSRGEKGRKY